MRSDISRHAESSSQSQAGAEEAKMSVLDYRSGSADQAESKTNGHWFGWAIYLGMSWTWCIGMFLPVLLVRDYGVWASVVFAVPNVLGAAAMGWVLSRDDSYKIV